MVASGSEDVKEKEQNNPTKQLNTVYEVAKEDDDSSELDSAVENAEGEKYKAENVVGAPSVKLIDYND